MKLHPLPLAAFLAFGFANLSQAQVVLFSNLGQQDNGAGSWVNDATFLANDFLTDDTSRTITSITARMDNSSLISQNVLFGIYSNDGIIGRPGTLVSLFDTATIPPRQVGCFHGDEC